MDPETRELTPRLLPLVAEAAHAAGRSFADAWRARRRRRGDLAHVTGYASKAAEQAARHRRRADALGDLDAPAVSAEVMADAIALAQFYLVGGGPARRCGDRLGRDRQGRGAAAMAGGGWPHPDVTARDVVQFGPNALRETKAARATLEVLAQHGWLVALDPGAEVRGAPRKEAWRIVRGAGHVV